MSIKYKTKRVRATLRKNAIVLQLKTRPQMTVYTLKIKNLPHATRYNEEKSRKILNIAVAINGLICLLKYNKTDSDDRSNRMTATYSDVKGDF
ncbi:MAG: hypothetical protein ACPL7I_08505 [Myxococcota bacterium]